MILTRHFGPCLLVLAAFVAAATWAVQPDIGSADAPVSETETVSAADELALRQSQLAEKYSHLETLMLKMAEFDAAQNPRRAALLKQALAQSKDKHIHVRLEEMAQLLHQQQLSRAVEGQQAVKGEIAALLDLLLTEDRPDRLKSQQQRVQRYLQEVERILRLERSVQGRTEAGEDAQRLADEQGRIAGRTEKLGQRIDENETPAGSRQPGAARPPSAERSTETENPSGQNPSAPDQTPQDADRSSETPPESPSSDAPSPAAEPDSQDSRDGSDQESPQSDRSPEDTPADSSSPADTNPPANSNPSPSGQPSPAPPSPSPPIPSGSQSPPGGTPPDSQDASPPQDSFPGRQQIRQAHQRMLEAQRRLEKAQREGATAEQEEARRLLEQAKAELEEILRQMREEEIERTLVLLEARFRKMLEMQLKVYERTKQLDTGSAQQQPQQLTIQAARLSLDEEKIVEEADRALALMREEGSSVAFPEAVEQVRADMQQIVEWLAASQVGSLTQDLEQDVIAALEEIIQAVEQAQEDAERRRQQPPMPPQNGQPEEPPLVDQIAELKMIRALQMRVNKRTQQYAGLLADAEDPVGQATDGDLINRLQQLSERQKRIGQITRDIVLGRNR